MRLDIKAISVRCARWLFLSFLLLLIFTFAVRVRSFVLARRIQSVLSGLEHVRIDQTTKDQFTRSVPSLVQDTYRPDLYEVRISNEDDRKWLWRLAEAGPIQRLWPSPLEWIKYPKGPLDLVSFPFRLAYWLGWRYVNFRASAIIRDGRVAHISYTIDTDIEPATYHHDSFVSVASFHTQWSRLHIRVPVTDAEDESPAYRIRGTDHSLRIEYSPDASPALAAHAFRLNLSCYWSVRGCASTRQIAPLLWADKQSIEARAFARLHSNDPCPPWVLAGRVRFFRDLDVNLLEIAAGRSDLIAVLHGMAGIVSPQLISTPASSTVKARDRMLAFAGAKFESCQVVPATQAAISVIRSTIPVPQQVGDAN
jgi:hypothetical protein